MATWLPKMSSEGPCHLTGTTPARFHVVISLPAESSAVIDIVCGTILMRFAASQMEMSMESESTGRDSRTLS